MSYALESKGTIIYPDRSTSQLLRDPVTGAFIVLFYKKAQRD